MKMTWQQSARLRALRIDYKTRSVAGVRDQDGRPIYEVLCYGLTHSDLASVSLDADSPGTLIARRLEARGIPVPMMSIFDTGPVKDEFR